jgi:hypothetical protein
MRRSSCGLTFVTHAWLAIAIGLPGFSQPAGASQLQVRFTPDGISTLKFGDTDLLTQGNVGLARLRFASPDNGQGFSKRAQTYDSDSHTIVQSYDWGKVRFAARAENDRLLETVEISNDGKNAITEVGVDLMHIQFPAVPAGVDWQNRFPVTRERPDVIPAILADWGAARLAVCSEDQEKPVNFAVWPLPGKTWGVWVWFNRSPLEPGTKIRATISLRFAGNDGGGWSIARDVLSRFAELHPSILNWPDRRPIGSAFLATSVAGYARNPRGWFMDPNIDVTTPAGLAGFKAELDRYEDAVLVNAKKMDAQGIIVWDIEGQEMPHATSYLADPRMLPRVAPEMEPLADGFFKRLRDAGLRTGISVRPTRVVSAAPAPGWKQQDVSDPVREMSEKIFYAQKRWGCTLFYIDSNVVYERDPNGQVTGNPPMSADDFHRLAQLHRDCLLMPEHHTDEYWAYTAPYGELRLGTAATPEEIRLTYPHAFSVLRVVDGPPLDGLMNQLAATVRAGDVLLFRPWWDDPANSQIARIYGLSKQPQASSN